MSGTPIAVGDERLGWRVTAAQAGPPAPRWAVERGGRTGVLTLFPFDGGRDDPHAAQAARCAAWAGVTHEALLRPETARSDGGLLVVVPDLDRPGEEPLPPPVALAICASVAGALHALHAAGVAHGELDAWCVVRREDGAACLLPPGLRDAPLGLERLGLACDPRYAAPEVLDGRPATPASDLASLGLLLVRLLTGRAPVDAEDPVEAFLRRVAAPVPDLKALRPDAPPAAAAAVEVLCAADPAARPATAREAQEALLAAAQGRAPTPRPRPVAAIRPTRLAWPLAAALGAGVAAWGLWQHLATRRPLADPLAGVELRRPL